ncbi:MAG: TIGR04255 family protein [Phyllobacteriaceae bacterium]|jgi:uncharacterized protein (TIGR04255 family)|nr:TIGR04255 family protein [Phyllobacteriaceae bacterium]
MKSASHLPKFSDPPLDEVVIGVQFKKPEGYHQLYAADVWRLFQSEYPNLQIHPPLAPRFETFGVSAPEPVIAFEPAESGIHDRFWFLSEDDSELVQFQEDRLISNWRRRTDNEYPHFESLSERFYNHFKIVDSYLIDNNLGRIEVNQAELSYINVIESSDSLSYFDSINFINMELFELEGFSFRGGELIYANDKPVGRMVIEAGSGAKRLTGKPVLRLSLTVRGAPVGPTLSDVEEFLEFGRELVVRKFVELTADSFHRVWGRMEGDDGA